MEFIETYYPSDVWQNLMHSQCDSTVLGSIFIPVPLKLKTHLKINDP